MIDKKSLTYLYPVWILLLLWFPLDALYLLRMSGGLPTSFHSLLVNALLNWFLFLGPSLQHILLVMRADRDQSLPSCFLFVVPGIKSKFSTFNWHRSEEWGFHYNKYWLNDINMTLILMSTTFCTSIVSWMSLIHSFPV